MRLVPRLRKGSNRSGSTKDFTATALNALAEAGYDVVRADIEPI